MRHNMWILMYCAIRGISRTDWKFFLTNIPPISPPSFMNTATLPILGTQEQGRKVRKDSQYTAEERAVLTVYKKAYKATTSYSQRDALLRGSIFPDIFNFWYIKEQSMPTETETLERRKVSHAPVRSESAKDSPESLSVDTK